MSDVHFAHLMVRTLLGRGDKFEQCLPKNEFSLSSFLTIHLYGKMFSLIRTSQEKAMGLRILHDAVDARVIEEANAVTIRTADKLVDETNKRIENVLGYTLLVDFNLGLLEARLNSLAQEMRDVQRMQRRAALVRLELSLLPVVGGCAVALTEASGQLLFTIEPEDMVNALTNVLSCGGSTVVDLSWLDRMLGEGKREKDLIKLTLMAFSDEFLATVDERVAGMLHRFLEEDFGAWRSWLRWHWRFCSAKW